MDTYIVVIPSPAFCIIFYLLHSNKKDIGENADIAIESLNLAHSGSPSGSDIQPRYSGNHRIHYTVIPRVNGLKPFTPFYERSRPRPKMLEVIVSDRL